MSQLTRDQARVHWEEETRGQGQEQEQWQLTLRQQRHLGQTE